MDDSFARHWQLNPEIAFLNHGSFGATPTVVLRRLRELQDQMEYDPIQFLAPERDLEPKLDAVRQRVADLVHAPVSDIAFVRNATDGVNAVVRSFPFEPDDELVVTNHGYNACSNAARYAIERCGGALVMAEVPFPLADPQEIVDAVTRRFSACTRLLLVDHITSPTGILFPIKELVQAAHDRGIRVLVDGAHAPGSIDVRIRELGCDYYTANHHKWLCGPKVSGFLYVRPEHQHEVLPTVISHAANRPRPHRSQFLASFDWTGTYDPCPLLALPTALDFLSQLRPGGWAEHLASNRALAFAARDAMACVLGVVPPAPTRMLATLVTLPLPMTLEPRQVVELQQRLFREARVELPLYNWPEQGPSWLRVSAQAYNDLAQYEYCARAIQQYL